MNRHQEHATQQLASDCNAGSIAARIVPSIRDIDPAAWDACANPDASTFNPFVSHAFLAALETAHCVGTPASGWLPQHVTLEDRKGTIIACTPCYAKLHSRGEYVFDQAWAEAYERAGGSYYPKLQCAVPFTPVPGPRLLLSTDTDVNATEALLARTLKHLCERIEASSVHLTFLPEASWHRLERLGYLRRLDQQFHWHNQGYRKFEDFLAALSSRKRKMIGRERRLARESGLKIVHLKGNEITDKDWDTFFGFYLDTGSRKWGHPYLNRKFFSCLGAAMPDRCLLMFAMRDGRPIAGALHIIGGDCLFGRYWGCIEPMPFLHFELCYYQAMEFAIMNDLRRVEAGAQGEHKLLRGYMPVPTYSAHWFRDPHFMAAVENYLKRERRDVERTVDVLASYSPYKDAALNDLT